MWSWHTVSFLGNITVKFPYYTLNICKIIQQIWTVLKEKKNVRSLFMRSCKSNISPLPAKMWFLQAFKFAVRDQI